MRTETADSRAARRVNDSERREAQFRAWLPTNTTRTTETKTTFADMYRDYLQWADTVEASTVINRWHFSRLLTAAGHPPVAGGRNVRYVHALTLKT